MCRHNAGQVPDKTAKKLKALYRDTIDPVKWINHWFEDKPVDTVLTLWYGIMFSDRDTFVRHDMTFLYTIFRQDRYLVLRRLPACIMNRSNNQEPYLYFTLLPVSKITSGERRNRRVPNTDLASHETFVAAGLHKVLEYGSASHKLNRSSASDLTVIELLKTVPQVVEGPLPVPDWYLSCRTTNTCLYLRPPIQHRYDDPKGMLPPLVHFRENRAKFGVSGGGGSNNEPRVAYPYSEVFGRGIVVSDAATYGSWTRTSLGTSIRKPEITVEL